MWKSHCSSVWTCSLKHRRKWMELIGKITPYVTWLLRILPTCWEMKKAVRILYWINVNKCKRNTSGLTISIRVITVKTNYKLWQEYGYVGNYDDRKIEEFVTEQQQWMPHTCMLCWVRALIWCLSPWTSTKAPSTWRSSSCWNTPSLLATAGQHNVPFSYNLGLVEFNYTTYS